MRGLAYFWPPLSSKLPWFDRTLFEVCPHTRKGECTWKLLPFMWQSNSRWAAIWLTHRLSCWFLVREHSGNSQLRKCFFALRRKTAVQKNPWPFKKDDTCCTLCELTTKTPGWRTGTSACSSLLIQQRYSLVLISQLLNPHWLYVILLHLCIASTSKYTSTPQVLTMWMLLYLSWS